MLPCPTGCEREAVSSSWFLWPGAVMKTDSFRAVLHSARQSRVRYKVGPVASLNYRARLCPRGHSCPSASSLEMELPSAQAWLGVMPVGEACWTVTSVKAKGKNPGSGKGSPDCDAGFMNHRPTQQGDLERDMFVGGVSHWQKCPGPGNPPVLTDQGCL